MLKLSSICALLLSLINPVVAWSMPTDSSTEVVERFQATLITMMKDAQKLGYEGRYKLIKPALEESHDLPYIAKVVAGRFGDQLTVEQKKQFVDTFSELSIATYAAQFDGYSGEVFKTTGERKMDNGSVLVQSVFSEPAGNKYSFDYVLSQKEGRWRIVNVIVDGVSDLAVKRSEYAGVLRTEGGDALIAKLKDKIAHYSKEGKK
jgi:phospholipid transport system substrate-binding protein